MPKQTQQSTHVATHKSSVDNTIIEVTTKTTTPIGKKHHKPNVTILLDTDEVVREQLNGFVTFLREHAIVGLAIGFIIGAQAQAVVKQLVTSFVDPMFQLLLGGAKLSDRKVTLHLFANHAEFGWGAMVYVLINLLFVLATVYVLIKIFKLDKIDTPTVPTKKPTK